MSSATHSPPSIPAMQFATGDTLELTESQKSPNLVAATDDVYGAENGVAPQDYLHGLQLGIVFG